MLKIRTIFLVFFLLLFSVPCQADYQRELEIRKARRQNISMYKASHRRERVLYRKNYNYYGPPVYNVNVIRSNRHYIYDGYYD